MNIKIFKEQITEDLQLLKEKLAWDKNIYKDEYAFNYWVLSNIYNLDEEECSDNITEYNDKGIDCFAHFEESKELYIIQNKYYNETTPLKSKELSDFLTRPLSFLDKGNYKKSEELQNIYNIAKEDKQYQIFLHFYITNDNIDKDARSVIDNFEHENVYAELFNIQNIYDKYYGISYDNKINLETKLSVLNKATYLAIRPEEYKLKNMSEAYYVMSKISDIYKLFKDAEKKKYPLFEANIREYLGGTSGINKAIINTLKNEYERQNFFYYNNGITIICNDAHGTAKSIEIKNPQIVNGCQTVNSIVQALNNYPTFEKEFEGVFVMVKILVIEKNDDKFYRDIVRYTNSQNSINDKVFGATLQPFFTIQEKIKEKGFLLIVKQSDKYQFKIKYQKKKEKGAFLNILKKYITPDFIEFSSIQNTYIPLESLIQIMGAFLKDAHFAYTKKSLLLKPTNTEYYQNFSTKIGDLLTIESMIKLIILYKKSELDKKNSEDKKSPSPYYLLNFLGFYLSINNISHQEFLKNITIEDLSFVYEKFKNLSSKYYNSFKVKHNLEYNQMVKKEVDKEIMRDEIMKHFNSLKEYNLDQYEMLNKIFQI